MLMAMLHGSEKEECRRSLVSGLRTKLQVFNMTAVKQKKKWSVPDIKGAEGLNG